MGLIFKEVEILGKKNKYKRLEALFDTGAKYNYIGYEFKDNTTIDDIGIIQYGEKEPVVFPNGDTVQTRVIKLSTLKIGEKIVLNPEFRLFNMTMCSVIIGAKLMQELGLVLTLHTKTLSFIEDS